MCSVTRWLQFRFLWFLWFLLRALHERVKSFSHVESNICRGRGVGRRYIPLTKYSSLPPPPPYPDQACNQSIIISILLLFFFYLERPPSMVLQTEHSSSPSIFFPFFSPFRKCVRTLKIFFSGTLNILLPSPPPPPFL